MALVFVSPEPPHPASSHVLWNSTPCSTLPKEQRAGHKYVFFFWWVVRLERYQSNGDAGEGGFSVLGLLRVSTLPSLPCSMPSVLGVMGSKRELPADSLFFSPPFRSLSAPRSMSSSFERWESRSRLRNTNQHHRSSKERSRPTPAWSHGPGRHPHHGGGGGGAESRPHENGGGGHHDGGD